jgi:hypothetical protein
MRALRLVVPQSAIDKYQRDLDFIPPVTRESIMAAKMATWQKRREIERQFGVTFDPNHDGQLLRDRRTK